MPLSSLTWAIALTGAFPKTVSTKERETEWGRMMASAVKYCFLVIAKFLFPGLACYSVDKCQVGEA
jgi:hypothetical protein